MTLSFLPSTGAVNRLAHLFSDTQVLVLTGAGISTGSGIPDYRGPNGVNHADKPITLPEFLASSAARQKYWARSHAGWQRFRTAKPNVAHHSVAALETAGCVTAVVTQNVDGLHQAAGSRDVTELHGRLNTVICVDCAHVSDRDAYAQKLAAANPNFHAHTTVGQLRPDGDVILPDDVVTQFQVVACDACGGRIKPNVVMFGEHIPGSRFRDTLTRVDSAKSLVVLGSSLAVGSGYRFVLDAKKKNIPVALVTRGMTRADRHADIKIDDDLCTVLPQITSLVCGV